VARSDRQKGIDPTWPEEEPGEHPVSELVADRQASLSPYGDISFPLPRTSYVHPVTVINR
jgi:hypothetical protein